MSKSVDILRRFCTFPFFLFIFFLLGAFCFAPFLYAADTRKFSVQNVVYAPEATPEYIILQKTNEEEFSIVSRKPLTDGLALPTEFCTVCLPEGSSAVLEGEDGKRVELVGPDVFDLWSSKHRPYRKERVKITEEGTVKRGEVQQVLVDADGNVKKVGPPIHVREGEELLMDSCLEYRLEWFEEEFAEELPLPGVSALEKIEEGVDDPSRS